MTRDATAPRKRARAAPRVVRLALLAAALLSGCESIGAGDWSRGRLAQQCKADGHAVWLQPRPAFDRLLVLGGVRDPATTGGALIPDEPYGYEGVERTWFDRKGLTRVFVYMRPAAEPPAADNTFLFGPYAGAPEGVYQWDLLPADRPACAPYRAWLKAREAHFAAKGFPAPSAGPPDTCVAYAYRGALNLADYGHVYVWWWDASLDAAHAHAHRMVEELRRAPAQSGGATIARAVHYGAEGDLGWAPDCFHRSESSRAWFPDAPA